MTNVAVVIALVNAKAGRAIKMTDKIVNCIALADELLQNVSTATCFDEIELSATGSDSIDRCPLMTDDSSFRNWFDA